MDTLPGKTTAWIGWIASADLIPFDEDGIPHRKMRKLI